MACSQTLKGLVNDCSPSMGGIVEVLIANFADVTALTVADNILTAITMASAKTFFKYTFPRNTGSLSSNYTIDETTGANFVVTRDL